MPRYCLTRSMKAWKPALGGGARFLGSESSTWDDDEYDESPVTP